MTRQPRGLVSVIDDEYFRLFKSDKSGALAGLHVLELDDLHDLAVHFESHAVSKIACRNHWFILLMYVPFGGIQESISLTMIVYPKIRYFARGRKKFFRESANLWANW